MKCLRQRLARQCVSISIPYRRCKCRRRSNKFILLLEIFFYFPYKNKSGNIVSLIFYFPHENKSGNMVSLILRMAKRNLINLMEYHAYSSDSVIHITLDSFVSFFRVLIGSLNWKLLLPPPPFASLSLDKYFRYFLHYAFLPSPPHSVLSALSHCLAKSSSFVGIDHAS